MILGGVAGWVSGSHKGWEVDTSNLPGMCAGMVSYGMAFLTPFP